MDTITRSGIAAVYPGTAKSAKVILFEESLPRLDTPLYQELYQHMAETMENKLKQGVTLYYSGGSTLTG